MTLQLAQEEPEAGPWRAEPLTDVVERLMARGVPGRPVVLAVGTAVTARGAAPPQIARNIRTRRKLSTLYGRRPHGAGSPVRG